MTLAAKVDWLRAHPEHAGNAKTDAVRSDIEPDRKATSASQGMRYVLISL